jgi:hypothetical protein
MKNRIRSIVPVASITVAMATISTAFAGGLPQDFLGYPAKADAYTRVVAVDANTSRVNVKHNEIVRFQNASNGTDFVWRFYTPAKSFSLGDVTTPEFTGGRGVTVYVADAPKVDG